MKVRDAQTGRYIKESEVESEIAAMINTEFADKPVQPRPKKPRRGMKAWVSHHRVDIALMVGYAAFCLLVGLVGGYYGAKYGLTGL